MPDVNSLIDLLSGIPGIGRKSAGRISYFLLKNKERGIQLSSVLKEVLENTITCELCGNYTVISPCIICSDKKRDESTLCIVEESRDMLAIEETGAYHGLYHILNGSLNPLSGIGPDKLRIKELIKRIEPDTEANNNLSNSSCIIKEILVATNPTIDGEATFLYIQKILADYSIKISRIATGIPMGGNLEYADKTTLMRAILSKKYL